MQMVSGKHKGKSLELIFLKDPSFLHGLFTSEAGDESQMSLLAEVRRLIDVFDRKPFDVRCHGRGCDRTATRCSIYKSDVFNPWWWCDPCDPHQFGSGQYRIRIVRTFQDAIDFAHSFDDQEVARDLIRVMAEAKGLPSRLGAPQADMFFNS